MREGTEIRCVQPGERGLFRIERAFGRLRRWWLRTFRKGYVARMAARRQGDCPECSHDVIDPRDLKLVRNVCGFRFAEDPYSWRDRVPFARQGLVEVLVVGGGCVLLAVALAFVTPWLAVPPLAITAFYLWFFRDPERAIPRQAGLVVAPCDGVVDDICDIDIGDIDAGRDGDVDGDRAFVEELLGGPATRIGISLSLLNVHLNRCPIDGTVARVHYHRGVFKNAQRKGDHANNEQFWTVFEPTGGGPPVAVRQIAGPMARTIVNEARLGERIARGERFGMIKFGSRTELYVPRFLLGQDGQESATWRVTAKLGARVTGGVSSLLTIHRDTLAAPTATPTQRTG